MFTIFTDMKRAAVLHIIPRFTTGGAERLVLAYARDAKRRGRPVCVSSVRGGGELARCFKDADIPTLVAGRTPYGFFRQFLRLWQYSRSQEHLVIHTHVFSADLIGYAIGRVNRRVSWISSQHNVAKEYSRLRRIVMRKILRHADRVIAVSEQVSKSVERDFGLREDRILLIENGIQLAPWLAVACEPEMTEPLQFATIGRLDVQKGHVILFEALSRICDKPWQLHIYGDGPLQNALALKAEQYCIADKLVWHGVVEDIPDALASVDVVVQPSLWEGRSLVMMETMAAGRVVVATTPAAADILTDETGYVVPPDDADALSDAFVHLFDQRDVALDKASEARIYATAHFDEQDSLDSLDELYDAVI